MHKQRRQHQKGFTLIETVVAILILSMTVGALLSLTANSIFSVRYARNQIVANNLAQEALEFIRNNRDSARQQQVPWLSWLQSLNMDTQGLTYQDQNPRGCFLTGDNQGCIISPYTPSSPQTEMWQMTIGGGCTNSSSSSCPNLWFYPDTGLYTYPSRNPADTLTGATPPVRTSYIRWVSITPVPPNYDQLTVKVTVTWNNGITPQKLTQSMVLTNWAQ